MAVPGLTRGDADPLDLTEEQFRAEAGMLNGVRLTGTGGLTARLWAGPAIAVIGAFETGDRRGDGVHSFVIGNRAFKRQIVEQKAVTVRSRVDDDRRFCRGDAFDNAGQIERESVVQTENFFRQIGIGRARSRSAGDVQR